MALVRLKAVLWLHTLRLWRYKWSFLNLILSQAMWVFLFILGILLFVPRDYIGLACREAFWIIVAWTIVSQTSTMVGGWMRFFITLGMIEEHILRNISPFNVVLGRIIPSSAVSIGTLLFIALIFGEAFNTNVFSVYNIGLLVLGMLLIFIQSLAYGFTIAALSVRIGISRGIFEILSFAIVGLLMVPVENIPSPLNTLFLSVPYVAPMHLSKLALSSSNFMLIQSTIISLVETVAMIIVAVHSVTSSEEWIRRQGVKAVGFM